jgi:hypothetical protein
MNSLRVDESLSFHWKYVSHVNSRGPQHQIRILVASANDPGVRLRPGRTQGSTWAANRWTIPDPAQALRRNRRA